MYDCNPKLFSLGNPTEVDKLPPSTTFRKPKMGTWGMVNQSNVHRTFFSKCAGIKSDFLYHTSVCEVIISAEL